jgi:2'-deoxynucleoside 5'-phosphate N-hydrolase
MRIFFAGPLTELTHTDETKTFYKQMAQVAQANGFTYYWAFLNGTDPIQNPDVTPTAVYKTDLNELGKSDLMIAYIGQPSSGTGQEIEYAREHAIPVYLLFEKGKQVSRMAQGSPNIKGTIEFTGESDALKQLDTLLSRLHP